VALLPGIKAIAQGQPTYSLPDSYHFDYQVTQKLDNKKNPADSCLLHFFYTTSGDYAAARISGKTGHKENLLVLLTRDGNAVIVDDHKKNITIISLRKLMADLSSITKWIKMDSLLAQFRQKTEGNKMESVKTGHTKAVSNYTAEEYSVSDSKGHKASVWLAKVDFPTPGDIILGSGVGNLLKMMSDRMAAHPLLLALTQPMTLITEIDGGESADDRGIHMHTESISHTRTSVTTSGYQVNNYSNMSLPEIFKAEMEKKGNLKPTRR
jgi:hypothetical protein